MVFTSRDKTKWSKEMECTCIKLKTSIKDEKKDYVQIKNRLRFCLVVYKGGF